METAVLRLESACERETSEHAEFQADLHHVRSIYFELISALDDGTSPELCAQLRNLYTWCVRELMTAGRTRDIAKVEGVKRVTATLQEAWQEAVEQASL
jgi:flagellar biosynthetic protein FliS